MIYPIIPYGDPVLRKVALPIEFGSIDLIKLAADMFETMYAASGVGLAAPQIGLLAMHSFVKALQTLLESTSRHQQQDASTPFPRRKRKSNCHLPSAMATADFSYLIVFISIVASSLSSCS
jgi:hypothetical protein